MFQRPATSFQPAGSVGWAKPLCTQGTRNIRKPVKPYFCFRGQPHHSSQKDLSDGPSPWAPCQTSFYFISEASHIILASRIGWMGRACGRLGPQKHFKTLSNLYILFQRPATSFQPAGLVGWAEPVGAAGPRNIRKTCQTSIFCFRGQPHHSSQQDWLDGPSPWAPRAPETFKKPVKPLYIVSEASQQDRLDGLSLWAPETFVNPVKPIYFVSEASHIIPASRIGWMGRACGAQWVP